MRGEGETTVTNSLTIAGRQIMLIWGLSPGERYVSVTAAVICWLTNAQMSPIEQVYDTVRLRRQTGLVQRCFV